MTDIRQDVRRAYDRLGSGYGDLRSDDPPEMVFVERLLERIAGDGTVLDAGCGPGTPIATTLAEQVDVIGLDISNGQLDVARSAVPEGAFVQGEMTALPMSHDSVDGVVALHSMIHVPVAEHPTAISEFARVLEPGGVLLLSSGTAAWEGTNPDWLGDGTAMHWSYPGPAETTAMLDDAGFTVETTETVRDGFADSGEKWVALATLSTRDSRPIEERSATTKRGSGVERPNG